MRARQTAVPLLRFQHKESFFMSFFVFGPQPAWLWAYFWLHGQRSTLVQFGGIIWVRTWVGHTQSKCGTHCPIASAPVCPSCTRESPDFRFLLNLQYVLQVKLRFHFTSFVRGWEEEAMWYQGSNSSGLCAWKHLPGSPCSFFHFAFHLFRSQPFLHVSWIEMLTLYSLTILGERCLVWPVVTDQMKRWKNLVQYINEN